MASQHYRSYSCVPVVCTGLKKIKAAEPFLRACGLHRVCTRLKKIKAAEPFYDVQGDSMNSILSIDATYFFNIT